MSHSDGTDFLTPDGWTLRHHAHCSSTNDAAREAPAWTAVYADQQSSGRGRYGRRWQSDLGGLWLSAVLPAALSEPRWAMIPLAAGYAVAQTLVNLGIADVRLRWPNDILVGTRKCAGILVDRFHSDRCVVGIGLNVFNDPSLADPDLKGQVVRLKDLVAECPNIVQLAMEILTLLRQIRDEIEAHGTALLTQRLMAFWKAPRRVELDIQELGIRRGVFKGVDELGRIQFESTGMARDRFEPQHIRLLREI